MTYGHLEIRADLCGAVYRAINEHGQHSIESPAPDIFLESSFGGDSI
jgi:hypothetical protein